MSKRSRSTTTTSSSRKSHRASAEVEYDDNLIDDVLGLSQNQPNQYPVQFSQQIPDSTTQTPAANIRVSERDNFTKLGNPTQEKMITLLSRYILFHAFSGEPLDRVKLTKEAWAGNKFTQGSVTNVVLSEACTRIRDVWGLDVRRIPQFMESIKSLPRKYNERLYVVNDVKDDERGSHSRALHGVHEGDAIEKGLLMLVLAFVYCKGELKNGMRLLNARILYRLLHSVDEYIPEEPPSSKTAGARAPRSASTENGTPRSARRRSNGIASGLALTPNVDALLEKFVRMDYLLRIKEDINPKEGQMVEDSDSISYAMGPRSAMEVGRKQIVCFCAEILDQQPDVTMLAEIENDGNGEEIVSDEEKSVDGD